MLECVLQDLFDLPLYLKGLFVDLLLILFLLSLCRYSSNWDGGNISWVHGYNYLRTNGYLIL